MGAAHVSYGEAPILLFLLCNVISHIYEEGTFLWLFINEVEADIFAGFFLPCTKPLCVQFKL